MDVSKKEIEDIIGCEIGEAEFTEALQFAKRKQEYIFQQEQRPVIKEHWYLVMLTEEYVRNLAFSRFTMDLCRFAHDMEKEHLFNEQGTPKDNHIITLSAL